MGRRTLLSGRLLDLVCHAVSHEPVVWLKLLQCLVGIVDECESGALATTVLCPETED